MKFIFASDSFKGSLSSEWIADTLEEAARSFFPACETVKLSVADGGEGTVDAVMKASGGQYRTVTVHGPMGELTPAAYGVLPDQRVIIEMAAASGLPMVPYQKRNPLLASSRGTGELILDALKAGYRDITLGLGGSATNDGGMGAMAALGVQFLDEEGSILPGRGADLERVRKIDDSGMPDSVREAHFTLMCDVTNPLVGNHGATYTFGLQKGADPKQLAKLEAGMESYVRVLQDTYHIPIGQAPGGGAAGGLGAACMVFLQADFQSGIEALLQLTDFEKHLEGAQLVVTGEGRVDGQSADGKVLSGIGRAAAENHVPVIALTGCIGEGAKNLYDCGITSIFPIVEGPVSLEESMARGEELYRGAAERLFRLLKGVL